MDGAIHKMKRVHDGLGEVDFDLEFFAQACDLEQEIENTGEDSDFETGVLVFGQRV